MDYPEKFQDACRFKDLVFDILNVDNTIRSRAEKELDDIPVEKKICLHLLIIGTPDAPPEVAELCAVLLRRVIAVEFDAVISKFSLEYQNSLKQEIVRCLEVSDQNKNVRQKMCDVASELANCYLDGEGNNHWPEFLNLLYNWSQSQSDVLKECALKMFASVPGVFGNQQSKYLMFIHKMFTECLNSHTIQVRTVAVQAMTAFLLANDKESSIVMQFFDCIDTILIFLHQILDATDGNPDDVLRCLIELTETCPKLFKKYLDSLFKLCFKGMTSDIQEDSTKELCLEVLVTLCESAAPMVKKFGNKHIPDLITVVLKMMTGIEDDPKWETIDSEDDENDSSAAIAESSLDRLACALGGKAILNMTLKIVHVMLNSSEWKERYAGLMAISAIGEGCAKQMKSALPEIVDGVLVYLADSHNQVRFAACNAIGQMATDFTPVFQKKFHSKVIPALILPLKNPGSSRVQAHAGAALVNFFDDCPKNILTPYMQSLTEALELVISSRLREFQHDRKKLVLEQAVVTLASVADSAEEKFTLYYDKFIPYLKYIIQSANEPDLKMLRGKAVECISLIGLAVGKEKFAPDAKEVMDFLLNNGMEFSDDDPQLSYMIASWARICQILGKDFQPYLEKVMTPILKAASIKPELAVLDTDDMKALENDDSWEFVKFGEKHNFGIRTVGLDEKATACQMLMCFAKEVQDGFAPYVEITAEIMIPMLKFYFHDAVRISAGEIIPYLLECAKFKGEDYLQKMWNLICPNFLQALDSEPEIEVICEHFSSFGQCIIVMNLKALQEQELIQLIDILKRNLENIFKKSESRNDKRKEEDYDDVVEDGLQEENEEDNYLLCKISETLGVLFGVYKHDFLPYFEKSFLEQYVFLLGNEKTSTERHWSLFLFSDIIEYCGRECLRYKDYFLNPLLAALQHDEPDLRQTAGYAFGMLAVHGGHDFVSFCFGNLPILAGMINKPDSRTEENEMATENLISAVTKFFVTWMYEVNVNEMIPVWLTWLPVWEDGAEVETVYSFFCSLLETHHEALFGKDNCNLPRIVSIIADTFFREALDLKSDLGQKLLSFLREIKNNEEIYNSCLTHLNFDQQKTLSDIFAAVM